MSSRAPVGVFDSGLGGLSVAREIRELLPAEPILYLADTLNCPYGGRPLEEIRALSLEAGTALVDRGAKVIVAACNTASGAGLETLREELPVPIIGLEPAVKPAARLTSTNAIGVMATAATLRTERFQRLARNHASSVNLVARACPGLVELVEAGELSGDRVRATLEEIVAPLREANVDAVVLGCTHYPFLREAIQEALGPGVLVIDSGNPVARQVERVLRASGQLDDDGREGAIHLLTTGDAEQVNEVAMRLWGAPFDSYSHVSSRGGAPPPGSST